MAEVTCGPADDMCMDTLVARLHILFPESHWYASQPVVDDNVFNTLYHNANLLHIGHIISKTCQFVTNHYTCNTIEPRLWAWDCHWIFLRFAL